MTCNKGGGTCAAPQTEPPHASLWQSFRIECEKQTRVPCRLPFCGCAVTTASPPYPNEREGRATQ